MARVSGPEHAQTPAWPPGVRWLAGVDEAGRGPLAGPVVAAAVILDPHRPVPKGLRDSKQLSAARREQLFEMICDPIQGALASSVALASVAEIDSLNILQASLLAMQRAVQGLSICPQRVWVDGQHCPHLPCPVEAFVKGDQRVSCIAAASILAKVVRDRTMVATEALYPGYGFAKHKGYPTAEHLAALQRRGPSAAHRHSFAPVRALLALN